MGVLPCVRNNCDNIMCDHIIDAIGYICYDCKEELENSNPHSLADIRAFIATPKVETTPDEFNLDDYITDR